MSKPDCTVVIASYNRAAGLSRLLESLKQQDIRPDRFEVVAVDDGSTDGTWDILASADLPFRMRALWQRNQGPGAARDAAVRAAEGEIIVSLDDDVRAAPDLLRRHLEAHAAEPNIVAIGRMTYEADARLKPWVAWESTGLNRQYESMLRGDWAPTPRQFYTANASVARQAILDAGSFDPLFRRAEDVELAYRLRDMGLEFRFLSNAVIYHRPNRTFRAWRRMAWLYGYYDIAMWRDKGREHILRVMGREFVGQRHPMLQRAARLIVGRPKLLGAFAAVAAAGARVLAVGRASRSNAIYSAIFNLLYYQGVCEALGSRSAFRSALDSMPASEPGYLATSRSET